MSMEHHNTFGAIGSEILALGATIGGLVSILPAIATLLGIAWYAVNLYDWFINRHKHETATIEEDPLDNNC